MDAAPTQAEIDAAIDYLAMAESCEKLEDELAAFWIAMAGWAVGIKPEQVPCDAKHVQSVIDRCQHPHPIPEQIAAARFHIKIAADYRHQENPEMESSAIAQAAIALGVNPGKTAEESWIACGIALESAKSQKSSEELTHD